MTRYIPIDTNKIRNLITDIENSINKLSDLSKLDIETFKADNNSYAVCEHHLRRALEGILTVSTHILSRLPVKTKDYQDIIISLAKQGIIPNDFAERNKKLAGYRNRLVHMYWEVSMEELHQIINQHIEDLKKFNRYFQEVLQDPKKFNLKIE